MKKETDEDLDKLFKKGLEDPINEAAFRETDWDAMEQLLDEGKKRPAIIFLLPWLSTAAAVVLVLLGWLIFRPHVVRDNVNKGQSQMAVAPKHTGTSGGATTGHESAVSSKQKTSDTATYANNPVHHGEAKKTDRSLPYLPVSPAAALPAKGIKDVNKEAITSNIKRISHDKKEVSVVDDQKQTVQGNTLANNEVKKDIKLTDGQQPVNGNALANNGSDKKELGKAEEQKQTVQGNALANNSTDKKELGKAEEQKQPANTNAIASTKVKLKNAAQSGLSARPVYAVSVIASSDMNTVGFQGGRLGGNFGAMFSVNIKKWTVTTGAMYSIKPYQENFADYHTNYVFKTNPSSIGVNCKMIDIPFNVNYQVYKNRGNKITLGTGLSSYIILREDYKFNYSNNNYINSYGYGASSPSGPSGYSVINRNRNIFGVLNLDATYDHQINSKLGISLQPYVKLPFSNIGESQAKLQSTGIAVGFSYNLNSFKKPN
jgi:hypothetical protein